MTDLEIIEQYRDDKLTINQARVMSGLPAVPEADEAQVVLDRMRERNNRLLDKLGGVRQ